MKQIDKDFFSLMVLILILILVSYCYNTRIEPIESGNIEKWSQS
jgi:hypothetical protein